VFQLRNLGFGGSYDAGDRTSAGYAMLEYPLTERVRIIGGARVENADITVHSTQTSGAVSTAKLANTDVLPSLAVNVRVSDAQNVRLSASRTLARPEYRELSPVNYADVLGGELLFGNASLKRSLIENYDVRWELYPGPGEVLSVGAFAKRFHDPIERVDVATSGLPQVTFVNAEAATNYGVELEARQALGFLAERLAGFTAFSNLTLMRSEITIGNGEIASRTNNSRAMVGQAPYLVNAGLTYTTGTGRSSATVLFNRVGERIVAAGTNPLPDAWEQPRNMLDLSLRFPVWGSVAGKVDVRNALDARSWIRQGTVTRESYRSGRVATLGLSWRP
jgi:TonB-dependent receptor